MIEGLSHFTEFESRRESEIKFWLPKYFPKNIRVIITVDKNKPSYANLIKRGCQILEIGKNPFESKDLFLTLEKRSFLMPPDYVKDFLANLKEKGEDCNLERTSMKTLVAVFCPYETPGIFSKDMADMPKVSSILSSLDFATL